jgi:hypothetical protein
LVVAFWSDHHGTLLATSKVAALGLMFAVGTLAVLQAKSFLAQDRCLDRGGSFDRETERCIADAGMPPGASTRDPNRKRLMRIIGWDDAPGPSRQIAEVASRSDAGDYCCQVTLLAKRHGCLVHWDSTTVLNGNPGDMDLAQGSDIVACSSRGDACGETVLCRCDEVTDGGSK